MLMQLKEVDFELSPLSDSELKEKLWLERKIERSLHGEVEKWRALRDIVEKRLYRPLTKDEYCKTRWGFSEDAGEFRIYAAKLVDAMEENPTFGRVNQESFSLHPTKSRVNQEPFSQDLNFVRLLPIPHKLDQVRAYRGLPIDVSIDLYSQAVEENNGFPPDRKLSEGIVRKYKNQKPDIDSTVKYTPLMIVKVNVKNEESKTCYCRISSVNRTKLTIWQRDMTTDQMILKHVPFNQVSCLIEEVEDDVMSRIASIEETGKAKPIHIDTCNLLKRAVFLTPEEEEILQGIEEKVGLRKLETIEVTSVVVPVLDEKVILPLLQLAKKLKPELLRSRSYKELQSLFLQVKDPSECKLIKQFVWELMNSKEKEIVNRLKIPFRVGEKVIYDSEICTVEIEGQSYTKLELISNPIPNDFLTLVID